VDNINVSTDILPHMNLPATNGKTVLMKNLFFIDQLTIGDLFL